MITRRCSERRLFLRPDRATNNAFIYCLALAARRANVQVTFAIAMSNHHHTGIHDPDGNFPIFLEHFHGLLARCQNAYLGRFESFWSSEPTSVVRLVEPNDILNKMTYAFANPAAADLVETIEDWPGAHTFRETRDGGELVATRPTHFFREDGVAPKTVSLALVRPHGFEHLSQREWSSLLVDNTRRTESEHQERRQLAGASVLGRRRVLEQAPFGCPKSPAERFRGSPRVAASNKWSRVESLRRDRSFLNSYRAAFDRHLAGLASVIFPAGTYWMRKFGLVLCEVVDTAKHGAFPLPSEGS
jgi:putative transposase